MGRAFPRRFIAKLTNVKKLRFGVDTFLSIKNTVIPLTERFATCTSLVSMLLVYLLATYLPAFFTLCMSVFSLQMSFKQQEHNNN
jgi:hypothetical protein